MVPEFDVETLVSTPAAELFPGALSPEGCRAGLLLRHGQFEGAHEAAQDLHTAEGSFWHGILHRREPDPGNAAYWFRRAGNHPVFPALRDRAAEIAAGSSFHVGEKWDPFAWIDFWEQARRKPGSAEARIAAEIEEAEWELLFAYCAQTQSR